MEKKIVCDNCGLEMDARIETRIRVIGQDEERADVIETYFACPMCKKEYTVLVTDKKQRVMIRERVKIQKNIQRAKNRRDGATVEKNLRKHERIKEEILDREAILMQKYIKE